MGEGNGNPLQCPWASLVVQLVRNLPAMWETWVQSLGWQDPLEKGKATHSSILAWRIPWTVYSMGSQRIRHDWATFTSVGFKKALFGINFDYLSNVKKYNYWITLYVFSRLLKQFNQFLFRLLIPISIYITSTYTSSFFSNYYTLPSFCLPLTLLSRENYLIFYLKA